MFDKHMLIEPRNFDEDYDPSMKIVNFNPLNSDGSFSDDGSFSEILFGNLSNSSEYTCKCGHLNGHFYEDYICPSCNTKVEYRGINVSREGWVDLGDYLINPLIYKYLKKIFGNALLTDILTYKGTIDINGIINKPEEYTYPYSNIGYKLFYELFDKILADAVKHRKAKSDIRYEMAFINEHREKVFISKFPLINPRLRPAHAIGVEFSFSELNIYYNYIIKHSTMLANASNLELKQEITIESFKRKIQENLNLAFDNIIDSISTKEGFIRSSLIGNRLNFSARNVITPCDISFNMDECAMPYLTALELMKPLIINKIRKIKRVNYKKAHLIFNNASLRFSKFIHSIMNELIKSDNISIILNRNPSIAIGSVLKLKIKVVKDDINDYTLSITNNILQYLGADYDGDVLNIILLYSKSLNDFFDKFKPSNLIINYDSGRFNDKLYPFKDYSIGLQTLIN